MAIKIKRSNMFPLCWAFSFLWVKRIYIGPRFDAFPEDVKAALLAHEEGHVVNHHSEIRLLCMIFCPWWMDRLARWQEMQADLYAASKGHADGLYKFLNRSRRCGTFYPTDLQRRRNLVDNGFIRLAPDTGNLSPGTA